MARDADLTLLVACATPQESLRTRTLSAMASEGWQQLKRMRRLYHRTFDKLRDEMPDGVTKEALEREVNAAGEVSRQELLITPKPQRLLKRLHRYVCAQCGSEVGVHV